MSQANDFRKEAHEIIDRLPSYKGQAVLQVLRGLEQVLLDDEDDEVLYEKAMRAKAQGGFTSLDTVIKEAGFSPDEIRG